MRLGLRAVHIEDGDWWWLSVVTVRGGATQPHALCNNEHSKDHDGTRKGGSEGRGVTILKVFH